MTTHSIFRLDRIEGAARLPYSLKVLLENLLRNEDGVTVTADQVRAVAGWGPTGEQDVDGVRLVADPLQVDEPHPQHNRSRTVPDHRSGDVSRGKLKPGLAWSPRPSARHHPHRR